MSRLSLYEMEMTIDDMIELLNKQKEKGFTRIEVKNDWDRDVFSDDYEVTFFEFVK